MHMKTMAFDINMYKYIFELENQRNQENHEQKEQVSFIYWVVCLHVSFCSDEPLASVKAAAESVKRKKRSNLDPVYVNWLLY